MEVREGSRAGQGRAGQGRAGQGRAGQGRAGQQGKKAGAEEHSLPSPAGHWFLLLACEGKGGPFILSPSRGYGVPPSGA